MFLQIKWNPSHREIQNFAWTMLVALTVLGAIVGWMAYEKDEHLAWKILQILAGAGVGVFLSSIFLENTLGLWLYKAWMGVALVLGKVMAPVVIGVFYFLIVTPIGLGAQLLGRDSMQRKKAAHTTFWRPLRHRTTPSSYERQF